MSDKLSCDKCINYSGRKCNAKGWCTSFSLFKPKETEPYKYDEVKIPKHYTTGKYEVIDIIEDVLKTNNLKEGQAFCIGNALKYICRCNCKGNYEQDLNKAIQYLKRAIKGEW